MASTSKNPHAGFRDGDVWLRARLDDAVQLSEAHSCPRFVGFLDERQRAMAQAQLKAARGVNVSFYGGHDEAERTLCGIFPDFMEPEPALFPLTALAFRFRAEAGLTHRDFLLRYRQVLRAGGEIHFKTDNVGLFAFSVTEFPLGGFYPEQVTHDLHAQGIQGIMTDYEEKFHNMGTKINRCVAVKGDLPPQPVPEGNTPEA